MLGRSEGYGVVGVKGKPTDILPWANLIGKDSGASVMHMPLTFPIAIGGVAGFAMLFFLVFVIGSFFTESSPEEDKFRMIVRFGLIITALIVAVCVYWHRTKNPRPGTIPDLLGELIPVNVHIQQEGIQMAGVALQVGAAGRFILMVQNICAIPVAFQCRLDGMEEIPELVTLLQATEVALYSVDIPLSRHKLTTPLTFSITCRITPPSAPRIRHCPKAALRSRTVEAATSMALLTVGHIHIPGEGKAQDGLAFLNAWGEIELVIKPTSGDDAGGEAGMGEWNTINLGTMNDISRLEHAANKVARALGVLTPA